MHPVSALREVESVFRSRGEEFHLLEPVAEEEIRRLQNAEVHLPAPIRELLLLTRGVDLGIRGKILFFGEVSETGHDEKFPQSIVLGNDDFGNESLVDLAQSSRFWGPVFYICHDPPVAVIHFRDLADFIAALATEDWGKKMSLPSQLIEKAVDEIWGGDPYSLRADELVAVTTDIPRAFTTSLSPGSLVTDLRNCEIGAGFSWARFGDYSIQHRLGAELVFGVSPPSIPWYMRFYKSFTGQR